MQITRQTKYAILTILELAKVADGKPQPIGSISLRLGIPDVFLRKTVQLLAHTGIVATQRGINGGISLAVPATSITIADVVEAVEGKLALNVCLRGGYACARNGKCLLQFILRRAQTSMLAELSKESIGELVK